MENPTADPTTDLAKDALILKLKAEIKELKDWKMIVDNNVRAKLMHAEQENTDLKLQIAELKRELEQRPIQMQYPPTGATPMLQTHASTSADPTPTSWELHDIGTSSPPRDPLDQDYGEATVTPMIDPTEAEKGAFRSNEQRVKQKHQRLYGVGEANITLLSDNANNARIHPRAL